MSARRLTERLNASKASFRPNRQMQEKCWWLKERSGSLFSWWRLESESGVHIAVAGGCVPIPLCCSRFRIRFRVGSMYGEHDG